MSLPKRLQTKNELICSYLIPKICPTVESSDTIVEKIAGVFKINNALKAQELASPASFKESHALFSISSMLHSYHLDSKTGRLIGTRIWKKQELIFEAGCLFGAEYTADYVELLEQGTVLSISYSDLCALQQDVPEIAAYLSRQMQKSEQYYRQHGLLLTNTALQRVKEFEIANPLFAKVANNSVKAMHVGMTRQSYELQLKKIRSEKGK